MQYKSWLKIRKLNVSYLDFIHMTNIYRKKLMNLLYGWAGPLSFTNPMFVSTLTNKIVAQKLLLSCSSPQNKKEYIIWQIFKQTYIIDMSNF